VQEEYKSIHFDLWVGMDVVMFGLVRPVRRMGGMVVASKNGVIPFILAYEWHRWSNVLICEYILEYGVAWW
jgi:pilus assembly protein TadC